MKGGDRVIVIMAGGAGERFWPVSNKKTPKQLLRLHGEKTMLQLAFDRAAKLVKPGNVYIAAGERLRAAILANLPRLKPANYISEPFARNTAGCLGLAACHVAAERGPETVMGVLTADHIIEEGKVFEGTVRAAMEHAERGDLVTIGIAPKEPHTGFGYLELGEKIHAAHQPGYSDGIYRVKRFTEKPDLAKAKRFLKKGNYLWNSGMFFWRAGALLEEFERCQPEMAAQWGALLKSGAPPFKPKAVERAFNGLPSLPIDIAIMEKSERVAAVIGKFAWDDVGSWDAIERLHSRDDAGNCRIGICVAVDSGNNIIYNDVPVGGKLASQAIVLHGVHDFVVVRTERAIFITPKSHIQRVKEVVKRLADAGHDDLM